MAADPDECPASEVRDTSQPPCAAFRFEVPTRTCGRRCRNFKSAALASNAGIRMADASNTVLRAASLAALPGVRHAFFTRDGGVSGGVYASLNGGQGSGDQAERVRENRARMAATLGVAPEQFITAYQIHSP